MTVLSLAEAAPRLQAAYRGRRLIPFLGAGFSVPLKLPTWTELMGWMGDALGFEPELFELHGSALQLAGYFDLKHPERLPWFIDRMRERFHAPDVDARRRGSIQHQALARCDRLRTIYTTNFEHHIEEALRDGGRKAAALARLEDYMRPVDPEACQVVKFHGDLAFPETVVLTEGQFFDRFRLEAAPDQRLRSDLLSNVFLFLGYNFGDPNTRYIWWRMDRLRRQNQPPGTRVAPEQRSYFATFRTGLVQPTLLDDWHVDVVELDASDPSKSVVELLDTLRGVS
jgi:hypothetical protein